MDFWKLVKNTLIAAGLAGMSVAALKGCNQASRFLAVDSCLDRGGYIIDEDLCVLKDKSYSINCGKTGCRDMPLPPSVRKCEELGGILRDGGLCLIKDDAKIIKCINADCTTLDPPNEALACTSRGGKIHREELCIWKPEDFSGHTCLNRECEAVTIRDTVAACELSSPKDLASPWCTSNIQCDSEECRGLLKKMKWNSCESTGGYLRRDSWCVGAGKPFIIKCYGTQCE